MSFEGEISFFDKRQRGRVKKPLYVAMYSGPGVGKTSAAASFPKPHFFDFEESTHALDVSRTRPVSWDEIWNDLIEIRNTDKLDDISTIVFDTIDELERLIHQAVATKKGKDDIGDIGWQRGFEAAVTYWAKLVSITREIRDKHQCHIVFLAHSFSKSRTDLEKEAYFARYQMALHPKAADYIFGQVEMVLFAKKDIAFKVKDDKTFAKDLETRIICTSLSAYYDAKNRIGLPSTLPMPRVGMFDVLWAAYEKAFNETPESVYKECYEEMKGIDDKELLKQMQDYVNANRDDIDILKESLKRIISKKGGK